MGTWEHHIQNFGSSEVNHPGSAYNYNTSIVKYMPLMIYLYQVGFVWLYNFACFMVLTRTGAMYVVVPSIKKGKSFPYTCSNTYIDIYDFIHFISRYLFSKTPTSVILNTPSRRFAMAGLPLVLLNKWSSNTTARHVCVYKTTLHTETGPNRLIFALLCCNYIIDWLCIVIHLPMILWKLWMELL